MSNPAALFDPPEDATPEELRSRLRALATLITRAPVPIAIAHDPECRFVSANDALARLLGVDPGTNISLTPPAGEEPLRIFDMFTQIDPGTSRARSGLG